VKIIPQHYRRTDRQRDPGYAHGPFSRKFLMDVCSVDPANVSAEFDVCGFTRS